MARPTSTAPWYAAAAYTAPITAKNASTLPAMTTSITRDGAPAGSARVWHSAAEHLRSTVEVKVDRRKVTGVEVVTRNNLPGRRCPAPHIGAMAIEVRTDSSEGPYCPRSTGGIAQTTRSVCTVPSFIVACARSKIPESGAAGRVKAKSVDCSLAARSQAGARLPRVGFAPDRPPTADVARRVGRHRPRGGCDCLWRHARSSDDHRLRRPYAVRAPTGARRPRRTLAPGRRRTGPDVDEGHLGDRRRYDLRDALGYPGQLDRREYADGAMLVLAHAVDQHLRRHRSPWRRRPSRSRCSSSTAATPAWRRSSVSLRGRPRLPRPRSLAQC